MSSEAIYLICLQNVNKQIQLLKAYKVCVNNITLLLKGLETFHDLKVT